MRGFWESRRQDICSKKPQSPKKQNEMVGSRGYTSSSHSRECTPNPL